jgi:hypothetical protein
MGFEDSALVVLSYCCVGVGVCVFASGFVAGLCGVWELLGWLELWCWLCFFLVVLMKAGAGIDMVLS